MTVALILVGLFAIPACLVLYVAILAWRAARIGGLRPFAFLGGLGFILMAAAHPLVSGALA